MHRTWAALLWALMPVEAQAQTTPYTIFDETAEGWTIARRTDGCVANISYDGPGATSLSLFYSGDGSRVPLTLLVSNANWTIREGDTGSYRFEFVGTARRWIGPATTLRDEERGVVALNMAQPGADEIVDAFSRASRLDIYRDGQVLDRLNLPGSAVAVGRLRDCLRTFPRRQTAPIAAGDNRGSRRRA